jgi:hypothetical protein
MTTPAPTAPTRRRARIGTIVWGAILVGVAVLAVFALAGGSLGPTAVLWSVVGFGGLLVLAAVVTAVLRAARSEHPPVG